MFNLKLQEQNNFKTGSFFYDGRTVVMICRISYNKYDAFVISDPFRGSAYFFEDGGTLEDLQEELIKFDFKPLEVVE